MIVVDTSALIAIAGREAERRSFLTVLENSDASLLSAINYVEAGIILTQRRLIEGPERLDRLLADLDVTLREDEQLAAAALSAYRTYGKGIHPARLNLGDCFAYALAKRLDVPLLYKGEGFARTDIRSALQPT